MIKHVVMWKLQDFAEGAKKQENAIKMKVGLQGLKEKISVIRTIEVGLNINTTKAAYDIVLYSEFNCLEDLELYQQHPDHVAISQFVSNVVLKGTRVVVDYEVDRV